MCTITKLSENRDAEVKGNIPKGHIMTGFIYKDTFLGPVVGETFATMGFYTSIVTKIISKNKFRTLNSIYEWELTDF